MKSMVIAGSLFQDFVHDWRKASQFTFCAKNANYIDSEMANGCNPVGFIYLWAIEKSTNILMVIKLSFPHSIVAHIDH
jgi:hypothetical protein